MLEEIVECDVLCAGGGIAGLMAAIRSGELGARVIIAEKGNVKYSGCVYECPVPGTITLRIPLPVMLVYKPK